MKLRAKRRRPVQVETMPKTPKSPTPSSFVGAPLAQDGRELLEHQGAEGETFLTRDDARFADQVRVESQRYFRFQWVPVTVRREPF
jgi:hypothetical protein